MKTQGRFMRVAGALTGLAGFLIAHSAFAAGTPSGTPIANAAQVDYTTGSVNRTTNSTPVSFLVDNRVDLIVTEINGVAATVVPGQVPGGYVDPEIMGFTVTNEGNTTQDYLLNALNLADGQTINLTAPLIDSDSATSDATAFTLFQDDGDNIFNGTDTAITFLDEMIADETRTVWVAGTIPGTAVNAAVIGASLQATTADGGAAGAGAPTVATVGGDTAAVDVVFADDDPTVTSTDDGARDGQASDRDAMVLQAAVLTIVKSSVVLDDGFGGNFAIPGATVEYSVTVENTGTSTATAVSISDDLSVEIGNGTLAFLSNQYGAAGDIELVINAGVPVNLTEEADVDDGEFQGNIVTVDNITLTPGDIAVVSFQVTIQ